MNRFEFLVSTFGASAGSLFGSVESVDASHPRNRVSYLTSHAAVLVKQRSIEEAVSTAALAVEEATEISSARIDARLRRVRAELGRTRTSRRSPSSWTGPARSWRRR